MTDPDVLADYTCEFFGPERSISSRRASRTGSRKSRNNTTTAGSCITTAASCSSTAQADNRFARPQMPVPPQPQAPENTGDFWNNFGTLTDKDPANAWRYLNQAQQTPDIFRNKMLVME